MGRNLAVLTKMYYGALTKKLGHLELERYYSIIFFIACSKKPCSQKYIAEHLLIDKASMVRIMDFLSGQNFIRRETNPMDRREQFIILTEKAKRIVPEIGTAIKELNNAAMKGIQKKDKATFYSFLDTICTNLQQQPKNKVTINYKATRNK